METPEKVYAEGGLKSHRVMGLEEDLTPTPSSTPPSKGRGSAATPPEPADQANKAGTQEAGGGVAGFLKSLVGGTPVEESKSEGAAGGAVTSDGLHKEGTVSSAAVAPGTSGTGTSPAAGSTAATESKEASPFAPALESIAGPAEPATAETSPAGGGGYAAGVVSAVSAAAGSAVETIKHAAGYGAAEGVPGESAAEATGTKPTAITMEDLPKLSVVEPTGDGTVKITAAESSAGEPSTAAPVKAPAEPTTGAEPAAGTAAQPVGADAAAAPASGAGTESAAPTPAAVAAPVAEAGRTNSTPAISAFASGEQQNKAPKSAAEIKEDTPAVASAAKPGGGSKAGDAKEGEKAKASICGCCVIS